MEQRQPLYYLTANLLHRSYPLIETFFLTLLLSAADFGRWSWASAFYTGVMSVAHGGIPAALLRYSAITSEAPLSLLHYALRKLLVWVGGGCLALLGLSLTVPPSIRWIIWTQLPALLAGLIGEAFRAYLRGRLEERRILFWQVGSTCMGLLLTISLTLVYDIQGAAIARALQPVWGLLPISREILAALQTPPREVAEFSRFSWLALTGNLAMEALFFLPPWFIGWHSSSPLVLAYWRWATLLPFNIRIFFSQAVLYLYPRWARQRESSSYLLYRRLRPSLHLTALIGVILLFVIGLFWEIFPGESYLPARKYYWFALMVGYIWSTEALVLPNILSAQGWIHHFGKSYVIALFTALPFYALGGDRILTYLIGMGVSGLIAAFTSLYEIRRRDK
ncbi:MAG: hypothetical protein RMK19_02380 [Bacteroidia bacterium]|nr:hypothetical protein [Bacteroidia bacterium]MDW8014843.1 hypothetical protein [Bacteroidia bacterium]